MRSESRCRTMKREGKKREEGHAQRQTQREREKRHGEREQSRERERRLSGLREKIILRLYMIPQAAGRDPKLNDPKPPWDGTGGLIISAGSIMWPGRKGTGGFAAEENILRF